MKIDSKKILFLSDTDLEHELFDTFKENDLDITHIGKKLGHLPDKTFFRHLNYLMIAIKGILYRKNYDIVFFWQQYIGYYHLFISTFIRAWLKPCLLFYVIYKPYKNTIWNKIKFNMFHFLLNKNILKKAIFFSKSDLLYKKISQDKKALIKLASYDNFIENNYKFNTNSDTGYFFSGGTSNRDYKVFAKIASHFNKEKFVVACTENDAALLKNIANIDIYTDSYGENFSSLIINSKAVIIPILDPNVVSGQLVVIKALQAGKIVFISENNFLWDWVNKEATKKFIIPFSCFEDIELFLNMTNFELEKYSQLSREYYINELSTKSMYKKLINEINKISKYSG